MAVQFAPDATPNPFALAMALKMRGADADTSSAMQNEMFKMYLEQMKAGGDYSPIQSPWQGAARLAQGLVGGIQMNRLLDADKASNAQTSKLLQNLPGLGGGAPEPSPVPVQATPGPTSEAMPDAPPAQMAALSPDSIPQAFPSPPPAGPGLLSANPPSTHEVINAAKGGVAPIPLPRPNPQALAAALAPQQPQAPVMASDGMPAPRPPASIPSPFGVNIPVKTSSTLPEGLSPRAASTFKPLTSAFAQNGIPLNITSGYRDPQHNRAVGGANGSQHMSGNAIDISLQGMTEAQKRQAVALAQSQAGVHGFGYYPKSDSIHIDVRPGERAAWGQNYSRTSIGQGWPDWLTKQTQSWQNGQPVQMAQQPQGGAPVPMPRPRPPEAPQPQQPQQPQQPPEMVNNAPVRLAALGGAPSPEAPYPPQPNPAASAQPNMQMAQADTSKQVRAIPPEIAANIKALLANPKTRAYGMQLYQQYAKPAEVKPHDFGNDVGMVDDRGNVVRRIPKSLDTNVERDYQKYSDQERAQGRQPMPFMNYQMELKRAGATAITNDMRGPNSFETHYGEGQAKRALATLEQGDKASGELQNIQLLRRLNGSIETGKLTPGIATMGAYLQSVGIDPKAVGIDPNLPARAESMTALSNKQLMGLLGPGGFPSQNFSDTDRKFLEKIVTSPYDRPETNEMKLAVAERVHGLAMEKANAWVDARDQGQSFEKFERDWRKGLQGRNVFGDLQLPNAAPAGSEQGGAHNDPLGIR